LQWNCIFSNRSCVILGVLCGTSATKTKEREESKEREGEETEAGKREERKEAEKVEEDKQGDCR